MFRFFNSFRLLHLGIFQVFAGVGLFLLRQATAKLQFFIIDIAGCYFKGDKANTGQIILRPSMGMGFCQGNWLPGLI